MSNENAKEINFLVLGAQKAGTTSLHDWLSTNQSLSLPTIKETHFFRDTEKFNKGINWYFGWFANHDQNSLFGEVDPEYLFFEQAAQRIQSVTANNQKPVKLIFVFRNLLERAYSHYQMTQRRGLEPLSFPEALIAEDQRLQQAVDGDMAAHANIHHSYFSRSLYCNQLQRYIDLFPDSPKLFLLFDDLVDADRQRNEYLRLCEFLEVQPHIELVKFDMRSNPASQPRLHLIRDMLYGKSKLKKAIGKLIPSQQLKLKIAVAVDKLNQSPIKKNPNDRNWRDTVPQSFWDRADREINQLESMTGLDLNGWKRSV